MKRKLRVEHSTVVTTKKTRLFDSFILTIYTASFFVDSFLNFLHLKDNV